MLGDVTSATGPTEAGSQPTGGEQLESAQDLLNLCCISSFNLSEKLANCDCSTLQAFSALHHEPWGRRDVVASEHGTTVSAGDYVPSLCSQGPDPDAFSHSWSIRWVTKQSSGNPETQGFSLEMKTSQAWIRVRCSAGEEPAARTLLEEKMGCWETPL